MKDLPVAIVLLEEIVCKIETAITLLALQLPS
jgi:hypothetical protein